MIYTWTRKPCSLEQLELKEDMDDAAFLKKGIGVITNEKGKIN